MKGFTHSIGDMPKVGVSYPINNLAIAVANGAPGYGSAVITGLPVGNILFLGAVAYLQFTTADSDVTTTFTGTCSIGTAATVDGDVADAGEADILPSTAISAATAGVSPVVRLVSTDAIGGGIIDNTAGTLVLNLNLLIDDAAISAAGDFKVSGVVHLAAFVLGDD